MADIPAQCERCGRWFTASNIIGGNANVRLKMEGNRVTCPFCGGWGRIPDGTYHLAAGAIELIRDAAKDVGQLERLQSILETAQRDRYEPRRLAEVIELEAPAFAGLRALLPQSRTEIQNYIIILLAAISLIISFIGLHPKDAVPSVTQIFNTITQQQSAESPVSPSGPGARKHPPNAPCHCGSGKKYKKCHGAATR